VNKITSIDSLDDLKQLGSVSILIEKIEKYVFPLKVSGSTYEELFEVIKCLKKNWQPLRNEYFSSKRSEYIYYLLEHEGEKREKLLGIDDEIYSDSKKAKHWYKRIAQIIRADLADSERAKNAFQTLQNIYKDLTDDDAFVDSSE